MPKIKTRKSAVKRFHQTSSGKLMHRHTRRAHSFLKKSPGQKRRLYAEAELYPGKRKVIRRQLPNGSQY
jgi:large subunit ribosomal protein L35